MSNFDYPAIGRRIKALRKEKGLSQQELADALKKSLRTVQKYESGEIEVSISTVFDLVRVLDTSATYLLGYESTIEPIRNLADVIDLLFHLEGIEGLSFDIDVQRPPRTEGWQCSIRFDGKRKDEYNGDMCLFLEEWRDERENYIGYRHSPETYEKWKEKTLAYYSMLPVKLTEPEELTDMERVQRRNEYLERIYGKKENGQE